MPWDWLQPRRKSKPKAIPRTKAMVAERAARGDGAHGDGRVGAGHGVVVRVPRALASVRTG